MRPKRDRTEVVARKTLFATLTLLSKVSYGVVLEVLKFSGFQDK